MIAQLVVALYRFWHGRCHLKGGGYFLKKCSEFLPGLQNYPLQIEGLGTVPVDFRDSSGFVWLNHLLGEKLDTKVMEQGLFHALDRVLKEEDVFWDVGANIGTISVHVVTRHRHVRIFRFRTQPQAVQFHQCSVCPPTARQSISIRIIGPGFGSSVEHPKRLKSRCFR